MNDQDGLPKEYFSNEDATEENPTVKEIVSESRIEIERYITSKPKRITIRASIIHDKD